MDDDIEEILRVGEEKTAELNKKYENVTIDDLKNFTSDSAYQWNGEDWSSKVSWVNKACINEIIIVFNLGFFVH